jgi:hypothetical protein
LRKHCRGFTGIDEEQIPIIKYSEGNEATMLLTPEVKASKFGRECNKEGIMHYAVWRYDAPT